jgi:AP-1 complex subunit gamma-1
VEYSNLFSHDQIRRGVLEKMPPPQIKEESRVLGQATEKKTKKTASKKSKTVKPTEQDLLFDLMDAPATSPTNGSQNNTDLLADILGGSTSSPAPSTTSPPPARSNVADIMDLFPSGPPQSTPMPAASAPVQSSADLLGGLSSVPVQSSQPQAPSTQAQAAFPCYDGNGLNVTFQTQRNAEGVIQAMARFRNTGSVPLSNVGLQAAVPKSQKLQLLNISSTDLPPGAEATQLMRVSGCKGVSFAPFLLTLGMVLTRLVPSRFD